jgi:hypothetical protein
LRFGRLYGVPLGVFAPANATQIVPPHTRVPARHAPHHLSRNHTHPMKHHIRALALAAGLTSTSGEISEDLRAE